MIAKLLVVPGKTQHIANTMRIGPQNIALHGQTIAIPAHHLVIGLQAFLNQNE